MNAHITLGVDIGGSHISSALVNAITGKIIAGSSFREQVDAFGQPQDIINTWCNVIGSSLKSVENSGKVGIAMPGPFDYEMGISQMKGMGKYDALYGMDIRKMILNQLGHHIKILRFFNDAGCFLQGELNYGPASVYTRVMGFTLGTGFGSARGLNGLAQDADYWRHPFKGGIAEDLFSSKWFVNTYQKYAGKTVQNVKQLIDNVESGNPLLQVFDDFSYNMGLFLLQIYKTEQFECIVLGGNISKAAALFLPQLKYFLKTMHINAPVLISEKGEDAALIGAACSV